MPPHSSDTNTTSTIPTLKVSMEEFIQGLPKAELHLHIEGTFEPELMFAIAQRNQVAIPYESIEQVKKAYKFQNLQEFLDVYFAGADVLREEQDFYDLTMAYLIKIHSQNVVHTEVMLDPQTHTNRGVAFDKVIKGIHRAMEDGKKEFGITYRLIPSFLRHLDEASAFEMFNQAIKYKDWLLGFGLDSTEVGHPPSKFERVFAEVRKAGLKAFAHAGEEGPPEYIWESLDLLKVHRIDHGIRCLEDEKLVKQLVETKMALTTCPLSNLELKVVKDLRDFPLRKMMDADLRVTINSDDPAYFGGYMNENYLAITDALDMTKEELTKLTINGFQASCMEEAEKKEWIEKVQVYYEQRKD